MSAAGARDAFSSYHPAVNLAFFAGAIGAGVVLVHPAFVAVGCACGAAYYLLLRGRRGAQTILRLLPLLLAVALLNPLLNTRGETVLFTVLHRPYTREALLYGAAVAGVFLNMSLWFGCFGAVMTSDRLLCLFGNLLPSLSLLLTLVLRLIPALTRKASQISAARAAIGKDASHARGAAQVLGALASDALEGGVATADSMRSRGYGCAKRTHFSLYRLRGRDAAALAALALPFGAFLALAARGAASAAFTPALRIAPLDLRGCACLALYAAFLLIPCIFRAKEAVLWRCLRLKI